ncbi:MAG: nucleotidyltransferase [Elusimicrobia bacterium]|nr:nucleotidyltransferase [Elusimicrobiota bacterium]
MSLTDAVRRLAAALDEEKVPYMIIGGIANLIWGRPRATFDVDVTVWAAERETALLQRLCSRFQPRVPDPVAFVRDTRVLPLAVEGVPVDAVFGQLPYEERAIGRARRVELEGIEFRVCSPEDLVVHKIISERAKDKDDARELIRARRAELDRAYLDPIVRGLSQDLARPEIWADYERAFLFDRA